jgi:hypothetical protein
LKSFIVIVMLAASGALHAQTDDKAARRQELKAAHEKAVKACEGKAAEERRSCIQRELCAQAKDPKACEDRFAKGKAAYGRAASACEASKGKEAEYRQCMRRELCAQTKDAAKCEAQIKHALEQREKAREACKDMKGDEQRVCLREQRAKK